MDLSGQGDIFGGASSSPMYYDLRNASAPVGGHRWRMANRLLLSDQAWRDSLIVGIPWRWQNILKSQWNKGWEADRNLANSKLRKAADKLSDAAAAGLRLDSNGGEIKARADILARHFQTALRTMKSDHLEAAASWALREFERMDFARYWPLSRDKAMSMAGAIARAKCPLFWRRVLRKVHASTVEQCAIDLGLVNLRKDIYCSNETVKRRAAQLSDNARALDAEEIENEYGQRFKLSELAAKGTANKAIRRGELMVRCSGFDIVSEAAGDVPFFITLTCPSRMHKWVQLDGGGVALNKKYNGTMPGEAARYLSKQWARSRAALARKKIEVYGFRVSEPHHDGCPHWHVLLYVKPAMIEPLKSVFLNYFLHNDSPDERGARERRVTFTEVDKAKGGGAGCIAKYISKNIDGMGVDLDLYGNPIVTTTARVEAWASTHRIRQFQQIGGAPVGVWRELRRVNAKGLPAALPDALKSALEAVNIKDKGEKTAQGYAQFTRAMGGATCKRAHHKIRLHKLSNGEVGRYGEPRINDVVGVECAGLNLYTPKHMAHLCAVGETCATRPAHAVIESERCEWKPRGAWDAVKRSGEAVSTWTRVNNCTVMQKIEDGALRQWVEIERSKTGQFRPPAQLTPEQDAKKTYEAVLKAIRGKDSESRGIQR